MHLTEDFPISSRLIRKTFRDEQKMNPNSARNIWKLLARPEKPDPIPTVVPPSVTREYHPKVFDLLHLLQCTAAHLPRTLPWLCRD